MLNESETNRVALRDCVVGQEYVNISGMRIRILDKEETRARISVIALMDSKQKKLVRVVLKDEMFLDYENDNYIRTAEGINVEASKCVVGQEYVDDLNARVKILKKDKRKARVLDLENNEERDLEFKETYFVYDLTKRVAPQKQMEDDEFENELKILKERVKDLEEKNKALNAALEGYTQEKSSVISEDRKDIEYDEEVPAVETTISRDEDLHSEIASDVVDTEADIEPSQESVPMEVKSSRVGKSRKAGKESKAKVDKQGTSEEDSAETKVESKKEFVLALLRSGVQTRSSLANAIVEAGLSKHGDLEKLKGYISVILHDLEKKDGITITRPGSGQYLVK